MVKYTDVVSMYKWTELQFAKSLRAMDYPLSNSLYILIPYYENKFKETPGVFLFLSNISETPKVSSYFAIPKK